MPDFQQFSLTANVLVFAVSAIAVWIAGTRLSYAAEVIADRTGMGHALTGFLFLGGVTSLPELASVLTASAQGHGPLALSAILGSVATNVLLLAIADAVLGKDALTSVVARPSTLLQGTLGIVLLGVVAAGIAVGDVDLFGLGVWSATMVPLFALAVALSSRHENRPTWIAYDHVDTYLGSLEVAEPKPPADVEPKASVRPMVIEALIASLVILAAGYVLAEVADAIAAKSGLGESLVGFVLVGFATSLPEISSMVAAIRRRRYELAIGDIFGTNLFDLLLIPIADLVFRGEPILRTAGRFELVASLLGIVMTAIFVVGLLDRRNRTVLRMGFDSIAALGTYAIGLFVLSLLHSAG